MADVTGLGANVRVLPGLPDFQTINLRSLARQHLMQRGEISHVDGFKSYLPQGFRDRSYLNAVCKQAAPAIAEIKLRNGGQVDEVHATREIDRAAYELQVSKANRQSWIRSGALFLLAVGAFSAVGYGISFGITHFFHGGFAEAVQQAVNPIWFNVGGALSGAVTGIFIDKLTQPFRAWNVKFVLKKSPLQPSFSPRVTADFVLANQAEGTVDGRFNGGRTNLATSNLDLGRALPEVQQLMTEAAAAKDESAKTKLFKEAGMFLAGRLIQNETYWFNIDPNQEEIANHLNIVFGPHFMNMGEGDKKALFDAAIAYVRERRPLPAGDGRKDLETSIKEFYVPYLNALMYGVKPQAPANSDVEQPTQGAVNAR